MCLQCWPRVEHFHRVTCLLCWQPLLPCLPEAFAQYQGVLLGTLVLPGRGQVEGLTGGVHARHQDILGFSLAGVT